MNKKNIIIGIVLVLIIIVVSTVLFFIFSKKVKNTDTVSQIHNSTLQEIQTNKNTNNKIEQKTIKNKEIIKKINLFKNFSDNSIPLEAICELSNLPNNITQFVQSILNNSNNIYFLKKINNKVVIIYDNPENNTHGINITEISLDNNIRNEILFSQLNKNNNNEDSTWEYYETEEKQLPAKHVKYDVNGNILYTEVWNYSPEEEIKYEKKENDEKPISIKKEIVDSNGGMRQEHLLYDNEGNILASISIAYEGINLVRFTYYNSLEPEAGASVYSEYSDDGQKTKENIYSSDLKLQNTYIPQIKENERESITILNNQNQEINKLYSE